MKTENIQTQTWTEIESRPHNSTYPKVAVQWLSQTFPINRFKLCFYQGLCLIASEVLRNRHLRVAASCRTF